MLEITIGARYGKLTAIGPEVRVNGKRCMTCRCDCGQVVTPHVSELFRLRRNSCGCGPKATHDNFCNSWKAVKAERIRRGPR